jgi:hypothetical protein
MVSAISSAYAAALSRKSAHRSRRLRVARNVLTPLSCGERAPRHALPARDQDARQRHSGQEAMHVHAPLMNSMRWNARFVVRPAAIIIARG